MRAFSGDQLRLSSAEARERVRAGDHFPTDVLASTTAGIGVRVLVPHLHRAEDVTRRPIWIGMQPQPGGSSLMLSGIF